MTLLPVFWHRQCIYLLAYFSIDMVISNFFPSGFLFHAVSFYFPFHLFLLPLTAFIDQLLRETQRNFAIYKTLPHTSPFVVSTLCWLLRQGNWRSHLGTSFAWFIFDPFAAPGLHPHTARVLLGSRRPQLGELVSPCPSVSVGGNSVHRNPVLETSLSQFVIVCNSIVSG